VTSPVVNETSPAPQPVDRDPFLDEGVAAPAPPSPETLRRRRVLD
jgi:hypothetical protein